MIRNVGGQTVDGQMIDVVTGGGYVGTVTVYVTIDQGTQAIGTVAGGVCTSKGLGLYQYSPSQAETNGAVIAYTFTGAGAVPYTAQIATITAAQNAAVSSSTAPGAIPVSTIINFALKRINVLQPGQVADPNQMADALQLLNFMLDSWAAERMTMPFQQVTTWSLTSTKGTPTNPYTVGSGGDINTPRPAYIDHINYRDDSLTVPLERPLTPLTRDAYDAIPLKTLSQPLPGAFYYQPTYANNLGQLYLWMIPTQAQLTGVMYAPSPIAQFSAATTTVILPPAYLFAIEENLAVLLASTFRENLPPDPMLVKNAMDLKAALKRPNMEMMDMSFDPALTVRNGVYNIFSDSTTGKP